MKSTEGYWVHSERANAYFPAQVYSYESIPGGLRLLLPVRPVLTRGDTLNLPTLTLEFTACTPGNIRVHVSHFQGYHNPVPEIPKNLSCIPVSISEDETEILMNTGTLQIRIQKAPFSFSFESDGRVLTSCGPKNLSYLRWDRTPSTMFCSPNYFSEHYEPYMKAEFSLSVGEYLYGFGERFSAFVKNGQSIETWNEDGGTSSQIAYKSIPFYMTNRGYGVFVDSTGPVSFEAASEKVEYTGFSVPGEELAFHFFYGPSPREVLKEYTALTGRPALPPAWSFGLWLSTSFTTDYDEAAVTSFIDGMQERGIPFRVIHFDCFWMKGFQWCDFTWDPSLFPDVKGMLARYHQRGLKVCVWINPYIAQGTPVFSEAAEKGYLLLRADGRGIWQTDFWQPGLGIVDFTNPQAAAWYQNKLHGLLDDGVDCFKTDFGERIPVDVKYHDGSDPMFMHNYYPYLYNQTVFRLLQEVKGPSEAVVFARSAAAGCQQFPVHWGGDCFASYPSMAETLRGGLSFAMSGFSFWSHDISGFESTASPDLYKRWLAFGLLSTHSRLHGSDSYRVPWNFGEEASEVAAFFSGLKCRLMPYLFGQAVQAHLEGTPVLRPMIFDFPDDPAVPFLDRQYMLGDALLAAPVFQEDGEVSYYLPEGTWTHLLTGELHIGGRFFRESYSYFSLPLFVRENTLLAIGLCEQKPDYDYPDNFGLELYQLQEHACAICRIPDLQGNTALEITASREKNCITLHTSKTFTKPITLTIHDGRRTLREGLPVGTADTSIFLD